ncbi:hypothetical protein AC578_1531 [Pseudocercospora eumusae]|uniref:Uncharacterized protein n=1 Tax=Pseudocercospora eumusae TaxID=321146 RepID=A0A139GXR7_9PEZI|nr:hypothetical protein AC578_1531 [Pseudocercospora eumusae]
MKRIPEHSSAGSCVKIIFGAATLRLDLGMDTIDSANVKRLDTASACGQSEELLGQARAQRFILRPGQAKVENIKEAASSQKELGTGVDIVSTCCRLQRSLTETLAAVNKTGNS